MKSLWAALLVLFLFSVLGQAAAPDPSFFLKFPLYVHTPEAFADRRVGFLPADPHVPPTVGSYTLWYLHVPGYTMENDWVRLRALVKERKIPGLDFSGERNILMLNDIRDLHDLRYLNLSGTRVNPGDLITLAWMKNLEVVILNDRTTDDGLQRIGRQINLVELGLAGTQITDAGLASLPIQFPELQRLDLSHTSITDAGLKNLTGLPLRQISLPAGITDKGMETLAGIPTLEQIDLSQTQVTDKGIAILGKLNKVHTLFASRGIGDAGLDVLSHWITLRRLDLTGTHITDKGVQSLKRLKYLEELALSQTATGDASLEALHGLKYLRYLEISDTAVTQAGLDRLAKISSLQVISFTTKGSLEPARFRAWEKMKWLHTVIINGYPMTYEWIQELHGKSSTHRAASSVIEKVLAAFPAGGFVAEAEAAALPWSWVRIAEDNPDVPTDLSPSPLQDKSVSGIQLSGLKRIHYVESELENVVPAPSTINQDTQQDTQKNFLGDFSVGVQSKSKDAPPKIPDQP